LKDIEVVFSIRFPIEGDTPNDKEKSSLGKFVHLMIEFVYTHWSCALGKVKYQWDVVDREVSASGADKETT